MKKIVIALLLCAAAVLTACEPVPEDSQTTAAATLPPMQTTQQPEQTDEPVVRAQKLNIVSDGKSSYRIVYPDGNKTLQSAASTLRTDVRTLTGAKLTASSDTAEAQELEIVLGKTSRGTDITGFDTLPEGEALIAVKGKSVFILGADADISGAARFFAYYFSNENGGISIMSDETLNVTEAMGKVKPLCNTLEVPGLTRSYSLLHVTDAHMCLIDDDETTARKDYNSPRIPLFSADGMTSTERFPYFFGFAANMKFDEIVLTGDITDQPSDANISLLKEQISASSVKCVFTVGNHDWSFSDSYWSAASLANELPKFADISGGNTSYQIADQGEFVIFTVNNGMESFTQEHIDAFARVKALGKPVVLAMHIPITAPKLSEASKKVWGNRDICIGGDTGKNELSSTFTDLILAADSPVVAILCGHVHFAHVENLTNADGTKTIPQYVTDVAAYGNCRVLNLVPAAADGITD